MRFPTMATDGLRRPIIGLTIEAPGGLRVLTDVLVDTGADRTLFPADLAEPLGLDLTTLAVSANIRSALGGSGTYVLMEVNLALRRFPDVLRWKTPVAFLSRPMRYGILGTKGFFEFFKLHYNWPAQVIDIEPVGSLPS